MFFDWRQQMGQGGPQGFSLGYSYGPNTNPFDPGGAQITQPVGPVGSAPRSAGVNPLEEEEDGGGFLSKVGGGISSLWGDMSGAEKANLLMNGLGMGLAYKGARDDRKDEQRERQRALRERAQSGQNIGQLLARGFGR